MSSPDPAHDELVARCQQGDKSAFRTLFARHKLEVSRLVFRMLGPRQELEDVVQEVFVQVYRSIGDFKGASKFSTWLHRLTVNVVLMHRRAQKSRPSFDAEIPLDLQAPNPSPDEDVIRRQQVQAFYAVLDRLTEKKRTVFVLHEIEGLSPAEIAKVVGIPVMTVRTRLFYARREMIQLLREEPALVALSDLMLRPGSADLATDEEGESKL